MIVRFLILLFIGSTLSAQTRLSFNEISLERALQRAKVENKLIFIDSYASYCLPCKQMDVEFKNQELASYFNKHFINVKVNMEGVKAKTYKNAFQIVFLPSLIFIDKNGNQKTKIDNLVSANELLSIGKFINNKYGPNAPLVASAPANSPKSASKKTTPIRKPTTVSKPKQAVVQKNPDIKFENSTPPVQEADEKILFVMGSENVPPDVMREEAYFRMQLMDGSHNDAAKKYLATQSEWLTETNMRFIFDFLNSSRTPTFEHLIKNKSAYIQLLGEAKVDQAIHIITNKELERGFPRPSIEEAEYLYRIKGSDNPKELASQYRLNLYYEQARFDEYIKYGFIYLDEFEENDHLKYNLSKLLQQKDDKKSLKKSRNLLESLIKSNKDNELYFLSLAQTYDKLNDRKKAVSTIKKAMQICKQKNITNNDVNNLYIKLTET